MVAPSSLSVAAGARGVRETSGVDCLGAAPIDGGGGAATLGAGTGTIGDVGAGIGAGAGAR
jgi:hypothetical protein